MPFVPFKKKDDAASGSAAPSFSKFTKKSGRKRKPGKVAPAQKAMMQSGRMTGGSR